MRGLVKAGLLRRYRTDRFQTVYGLTQPGARWLQEAGVEAKASVRRVSDMSNPEHTLWAHFIVLAAEARGLKASTEAELLRALNTSTADTQPGKQGLLRVEGQTPHGTVHHYLRPDAVFDDHDGVAWIEIERSARGANRAAALRTLALSVGAKLVDGRVLRRVVVFTRTERIRGRVMAALRGVAEQTRESALMRGRRLLKEVEADSFEVWMTVDRRHTDGRSSLVDKLAGHVIVQELPTWLPRLRLDGRKESSTAGWLGENYLPYRRPLGLPAWETPQSPLLGTAELRGLAGNRPSGYER
ncbi:DNA-binding protein [Inhella sp.]|uniref:DNA-binding protein n=1 Tax=Inhella sp. TaxID=1921806 RepID=UPI0035B08F9C